MGLGAFFGGAASEGSEQIKTQQADAFKLKLQNAQIEGQLQNEMKMADYNSASTQATQDMGSANNVVLPKGMRANKADQAWWTSQSSNISKEAIAEQKNQIRLNQGQSRGMTVADFEDARGVKTGWKSDRWLNPTEVAVWQARLKGETPSPEIITKYSQQLSGFKLIEQLEQMRKEALTEVRTGPASGRLSNLAVAADQGNLYPKAAAYAKFVQSQLANLAHFSGEIGRLAEGDINRASNISSDFATSDATSQMVFDATKQNARASMATSEELFPQLRRQRENEAAKLGLISQAEAEQKTKTKVLDGAGFVKFLAQEKADEAARKKQEAASKVAN